MSSQVLDETFAPIEAMDDLALSIGIASNYSFNELQVKDLRVDREHYQRHLNMTRVRRIAKNFDPMLFDVLKVNRRANGEHFVIDGGHRQAALIEMGRTEEFVPCIVYDGLTVEEEAAIFAAQNNRTQVNPGHEFRALLQAGDPTSLAIKQIVEAEGLFLDLPPQQTNNSHGIRAVRTLQRIMWTSRAAMLQKVLRVAKESFGPVNGAFSGEVLGGLSTFFTLFPDARERRVIEKLQALGLDKYNLAAAEFKHLISGNAGRANSYAWILHREYNHKMSANKLPAWNPTERKPAA